MGLLSLFIQTNIPLAPSILLKKCSPPRSFLICWCKFWLSLVLTSTNMSNLLFCSVAACKKTFLRFSLLHIPFTFQLKIFNSESLLLSPNFTIYCLPNTSNYFTHCFFDGYFKHCEGYCRNFYYFVFLVLLQWFFLTPWAYNLYACMKYEGANMLWNSSQYCYNFLYFVNLHVVF